MLPLFLTRLLTLQVCLDQMGHLPPDKWRRWPPEPCLLCFWLTYLKNGIKCHFHMLHAHHYRTSQSATVFICFSLSTSDSAAICWLVQSHRWRPAAVETGALFSRGSAQKLVAPMRLVKHMARLQSVSQSYVFLRKKASSPCCAA